jgi:hypothetical protein
MKSYGGKALTNRLKSECEKYIADHIEEIKYELFKEIVQDDFRQAEAVMLYALSKHGYGKVRLQRIHEWVNAMVNLPEFNGKPFTCTDCMFHVKQKYGIDLDDVEVRFESKEDFDRRKA